MLAPTITKGTATMLYEHNLPKTIKVLPDDLIYIEQAIGLLGYLTKNGDSETDREIYESAQEAIENILKNNPRNRDDV